MIITLEEADGQPRLDSVSDKKVPLDILLPEQSCRCCSTFPSEWHLNTILHLVVTYADFPNYPTHPVLRNINSGYVDSISTGSDARSILTGDSQPTYSNTSNPKKIWHLFTLPFMRQKSSVDPFMSTSTIVEKPEQKGNSMAFPLSWRELSKKSVFYCDSNCLLADLAEFLLHRWLIGWLLLSLLLCTVVSCGVWIAARRINRNLLVQNVGIAV